MSSVGADANVVEHRQIGKQRDVLEGAADADLGDPVRRARQDALPFDQDVAGTRLIEPGRQLNSVVLPAPFGPIRPRIAPLLHAKGHAIQRNEAAEHDADVANREQGSISLRELCLRHLVPPTLIMERERPRENFRRS